MERIREAINQVVEDISIEAEWNYGTELKRNTFVLVYNKEQQVASLEKLIKSELTEKLHGVEMFSLRSIAENDDRQTIVQFLKDMAEERKQRFEEGRVPKLVKATVELLIADNHCPIETIKMIHDVSKQVLHDLAGFEIEYNDYLIFDFSVTESKEIISRTWLKQLETCYQELGIIPYVCTEELLATKENRYRKTIKTIASLIVMDAIGHNMTNQSMLGEVTWRCAAFVEDDKLRYYITNLFLQFMQEQNKSVLSEMDIVERVRNFLKNGITIESAEMVEEMRKMPMFLEKSMPYSKNSLIRFFRKSKMVEIGELIKEFYGNNNPIRRYADLNYENMHMDNWQDKLWNSFQMWDLGTRTDVEKYLKKVLSSMIQERKEQSQKKKEDLKDKENIKITLDNHKGKDHKECADALFNEISNVFRLMAEMEGLEREKVALEQLYEKMQSSEFQQMIKQLEEKQNRVIHFLRGSEYEYHISIQTRHETLLQKLFLAAGYWKKETIEEDVRKEITEYLKQCMQNIWTWQKQESKEIFKDFLDIIWNRKHMPDSVHEVDFWAVRRDRLRPSIAEQEYIFVNTQFFEEGFHADNMLQQKIPGAVLQKTTRQNILSLEYISIRDMKQMEFLALKAEQGDEEKD